MCGRYLRRSDKQRIAEAFQTRNDISTLALPPADYNIAPSTFQPVIRENKEEGSRELILMTEQPPVDLLRPFESEEMQMCPTNQGVGKVRNNGPEMLNSA